MPWIYLLLAVGALALALTTHSLALVVLGLLASLVFSVMLLLGLLSRRVDDNARDVSIVLDPGEIQRLREQAEARRLAAKADSSDAPSPGTE